MVALGAKKCDTNTRTLWIFGGTAICYYRRDRFFSPDALLKMVVDTSRAKKEKERMVIGVGGVGRRERQSLRGEREQGWSDGGGACARCGFRWETFRRINCFRQPRWSRPRVPGLYVPRPFRLHRVCEDRVRGILAADLDERGISFLYRAKINCVSFD